MKANILVKCNKTGNSFLLLDKTQYVNGKCVYLMAHLSTGKLIKTPDLDLIADFTFQRLIR